MTILPLLNTITSRLTSISVTIFNPAFESDIAILMGNTIAAALATLGISVLYIGLIFSSRIIRITEIKLILQTFTKQR